LGSHHFGQTVEEQEENDEPAHGAPGPDEAAVGVDTMFLLAFPEIGATVRATPVRAGGSPSSAFGPRFIAWLTTLFASVGLLLAALGVYGLLAMQVARRSREFGVRMALGAKARDVLLLVVGRGVRATVLGCALGVALALGTGRRLASLLYEVSPFDVVTLAVVPAVLLATATLAGLVPARRAARVSPTAMLREE
jgi:predicted lysophospholipase L1 biosynthesis ABC-type transport system permease subunit